MEAKKAFRGILVSETHWDREWYLSFQQFRKWLVKLIDDLVENLPSHPEFKHFMLDGQTCVVEDYLEIRPERKSALYALIQQNRIGVGPFYVLADEFLESGEGMIRNLLLGHKISESIGVQPMKVGYVPDTFGHIWQLPQILNGFGIQSMYYFRGYPPVFGNHEEYRGKNEKTPLEHFYQSPDGSKVLTLHHILGYGNAAGIADNKTPEDPVFPYYNAIMKIGETYNIAGPRTKSNLLLFMNGTDHRMAEWDLPDLIAKWNSNPDLTEEFPITFEHNTLFAYFEAIQKLVEKGLMLPTLTGEARGSMYTQVTPGCISTRMNLKLFNWKCSRELEKYAEPFATMNWILGGDYQGAFIEHGWKWLIQNHPHDSICGCSLDRVHEDMITRFNWSYDNANDVAEFSCATILSGIDIAAIKAKMKAKYITNEKRYDICVLGVFNPNAFIGKQIVEDYVVLDPACTYHIYDSDGTEIKSAYIHYIPDYRTNVEEGQYLYKRFQSHWTLGKLTLELDKLPACGYTVICLVGKEGSLPAQKLQTQTQAPQAISTSFYTISFNLNGSINVEDKANGIVYKNLNTFEDGADDGDEYDWAPLPKDVAHLTTNLQAEYTINTKNAIFTEVQAKLDFPVPFELLGDVDSVRTRSEQKVSLNITTTYRIYANSPRIEVNTKVMNKAKGHRLRTLFPSNMETRFSYADDHFQVLKRTIALPPDQGWYQDMQGIYHQDTFVDLHNDQRGLAVLNRGLCEFEIISTPPQIEPKSHSIALTLFRSVAWMSQRGHLGRKSGLNGPNLQTPGAQLMNQQFEFEYAILPHTGSWENGHIYTEAHSYNSPPRIFSEKQQLRNVKLTQKIPQTLSLVEITNPNVVFSSFKRSDRIFGAKDGAICRIFNPSETSQTTEIKFGFPVKAVAKTNLLEQDEEKLVVTQNHSIQITIPPFKITTLRMEF